MVVDVSNVWLWSPRPTHLSFRNPQYYVPFDGRCITLSLVAKRRFGKEFCCVYKVFSSVGDSSDDLRAFVQWLLDSPDRSAASYPVRF